MTLFTTTSFYAIMLSTLCVGALDYTPCGSEAVFAPSRQPTLSDSIAGKWRTGGSMPRGTKYIVLDITQRGDTLTALATIELSGITSDTRSELKGWIRDGLIVLNATFVDGLRMSGRLRGETLRMRVVPGRFREADAYDTTFRRDQ